MNNQFKVGDQVVRINRDNGLYASVGQHATVTALDKDGDPFVTYKGCAAPDTTGELWLSHNTKLLPVQESLCKFVPGTTYKDRTGKEYRFVIYAEEAAPPYRAIFLTSTGNITCRHSDGNLNLAGRTSDPDILPNKRTRVVHVYRNDHGWPIAIDKTDKIPATWKLIGEVVEEYEKF